tara:strand:+ start:20490 stop:20654 length:165 start_codon:yes stop_codon:yes gene_type:complete
MTKSILLSAVIWACAMFGAAYFFGNHPEKNNYIAFLALLAFIHSMLNKVYTSKK